MNEVPNSEITPPEIYFQRRQLLRAGVLAGSVTATALLYRWLRTEPTSTTETPRLQGVVASQASSPGGEVPDEPTSYEAIATYNNFYEFTTKKTEVARLAANFMTDDWRVAVGGLVHTPREFDLDDLRRLGPLEERIYRMRCVEAWSMVIPWAGFPLSRLLHAVQPLGTARYVAFETLLAPDRMPGQRTSVLEWPYVEGLRMDEAMHPLTILAMGLYERELPPQDGAPVRLVVPWKYGFKGIKSIVKITLVDTQPETSWNRQAPDEYGFYANVNPRVDHPRWSQATEQRIGELGRRPTLPFNGYTEQVAAMYAGMDLRRHF